MPVFQLAEETGDGAQAMIDDEVASRAWLAGSADR
jgi:metal-dependent amidase/aminoacylase/carboxypeptidase family protein